MNERGIREFARASHPSFLLLLVSNSKNFDPSHLLKAKGALTIYRKHNLTPFSVTVFMPVVELSEGQVDQCVSAHGNTPNKTDRTI